MHACTIHVLYVIKEKDISSTSSPMHFLKYKLGTIFDEYINFLYEKYCTNNIIFMNKTVNTRTFCKPAHTVTSIEPATSSSVYIFLHTIHLSMNKFLY